MKALVYHGPNKKSWDEVPDPRLIDPTDAIVSVDATTICGSDRHILRGDLLRSPPAESSDMRPWEPLTRSDPPYGTSRRATGCSSRASRPVEDAASAVRTVSGQCLEGGGWILGHTIDGTQAEKVRVPFVDTSAYPVPAGITEDEFLMLADILPTAYEVGVLNGGVTPGDVVAIVGAGPIGLSAMTGSLLFSPSHIIAIDLADSRLEAAKQFGADVVVNNSRENPVAIVQAIHGWIGGRCRD